MEKYQNGKIYKLTTPHSNKVYYGSTIVPLKERLWKHNSESRSIKKQCRSQILYQLGDVSIELVEEYPCNSRSELLWKEREYIENNDCVNESIPIRSKEELMEKKTDYTLENRTKKKSYDKKTYNKEKSVSRVNEWRKNNLEKRLQYEKEYRQKNKEKQREYDRKRNLDKKNALRR